MSEDAQNNTEYAIKQVGDRYYPIVIDRVVRRTFSEAREGCSRTVARSRGAREKKAP